MAEARTRRTPTPEELAAWRQYIEAASAVETAVAALLRADSGLSSGDYAVLLALSEVEQHRLRSSVLAAGIGWERSRVSHHLARMEARGLIVRQDCATDSRGAEVVATQAGLDVFRSASAVHLRRIREVFVEALTPDQLDAAHEISVALRRHLAEAAPAA